MFESRAVKRAKQAMDQAENYQEWRETAVELDRLQGYDDWRADDRSPHYHYTLIRRIFAECYRALKRQRDENTGKFR